MTVANRRALFYLVNEAWGAGGIGLQAERRRERKS
jgi:hypothetical protein